jgi:hypothetical protein
VPRVAQQQNTNLLNVNCCFPFLRNLRDLCLFQTPYFGLMARDVDGRSTKRSGELFCYENFFPQL